MSALPPSEDPVVTPRSGVTEEKRWEFFEQGIWVTKNLHTLHVSVMDTEHIKAVLGYIWTSCNFMADQNLRISVDLEFPGYNDSACWDDYYGDLADPKTHWESHPFVDHALQELTKRGVKYRLPYESEIPF